MFVLLRGVFVRARRPPVGTFQLSQMGLALFLSSIHPACGTRLYLCDFFISVNIV